MKRILTSIVVPCLAVGLYSAQSLHAQVTFTVENAGVQQTSVAGATTENFESFSQGDLPASVATAVGTLTGTAPTGTTSAGNIQAANLYGGAGGSGNYLAIGAQSGVGTTAATLTFASAQNYMGMWWSAGDGENVLKFYHGATLLESFNVAAISAGLSASYYGNPNAAFLGEDGGEPFVYLNFTGTGATTFTSVVFDNSGSTGTGFELDNVSIAANVTTPPGNQVPDATSSGLMLLMAVAALVGYRQSVWGRSENQVCYSKI